MILITDWWWQYAAQIGMSTVAVNEQQNKKKTFISSFYIKTKTLKYTVQYHARFDQRFALKGWTFKRGNVITWGTFLKFLSGCIAGACMQACNCACIRCLCIVCIAYIYYYYSILYTIDTIKNCIRISNYNSFFFKQTIEP